MYVNRGYFIVVFCRDSFVKNELKFYVQNIVAIFGLFYKHLNFRGFFFSFILVLCRQNCFGQTEMHV